MRKKDEDFDDEILELHTMPTDDIIEHIESDQCPCNPVWDPQNKRDLESGVANKILYIHNRLKDNVQ